MRHSDDQEYYIGLHRPNREPKGMPDRLVRVVAGDPSRGSIALENSSAPPVGSELQVRMVVRYAYLVSNVSSFSSTGAPLLGLPQQQILYHWTQSIKTA